ncbi:MAG: methionine adenosyltransferase, partial [Patescibacteria group bacterium]
PDYGGYNKTYPKIMRVSINSSKNFPNQGKIEIVERKGLGHPDSLACKIAENSCRQLCFYYKENYKAIPRFNIDQVEINGGEVEVSFQKNRLIKKGLITITGKATSLTFKDIKKINQLVTKETEKTLKGIFGGGILNYFNIKSDINKYSKNNKAFFENIGLPLSEDTSLGIGFYPYTYVEKMTLDLDSRLLKLSKIFPIGRDFKIMILRNGKKIDVTVGIAFISGQIKNINDYFLIKEKIRLNLLRSIKNKSNFNLIINAADDLNANKAYITATGTAAEHDKGSLGRGNGVSGLITPGRKASFEIIYGKNPIYNVSKIYNLLAFYLAEKISRLLDNNIFIEIEILSRLGNPINKPQIVNVITSQKLTAVENKKVNDYLKKMFSKLFEMIPGTNYALLNYKIINNNLYEPR